MADEDETSLSDDLALTRKDSRKQSSESSSSLDTQGPRRKRKREETLYTTAENEKIVRTFLESLNSNQTPRGMLKSGSSSSVGDDTASKSNQFCIGQGESKSDDDDHKASKTPGHVSRTGAPVPRLPPSTPSSAHPSQPNQSLLSRNAAHPSSLEQRWDQPGAERLYQNQLIQPSLPQGRREVPGGLLSGILGGGVQGLPLLREPLPHALASIMSRQGDNSPANVLSITRQSLSSGIPMMSERNPSLRSAGEILRQTQVNIPTLSGARVSYEPGQTDIFGPRSLLAMGAAIQGMGVPTPFQHPDGVSTSQIVATNTAAPRNMEIRNSSDTLPKRGRSVPIYMSCDDLCLSRFQCLARKQIELFEATNEDVEAGARGRNNPIVLGQVGIRCRHCALIPAQARTRGAIYYPTRFDRVYQTAVNMASIHFCNHCVNIPSDVREELKSLKDQKSIAGGGKDYWARGVRMLGVAETEEGLKFSSEE